MGEKGNACQSSMFERASVPPLPTEEFLISLQNKMSCRSNFKDTLKKAVK